MADIIGAVICGLIFIGFGLVCGIGGYRQNVRENEPENQWFLGVCLGLVLLGLDVVINANVVAAGPHHRDILDHPDGLGMSAPIVIALSIIGWVITVSRQTHVLDTRRRLRAQEYLKEHNIAWIDPKCGCTRSPDTSFHEPCPEHAVHRPWREPRYFQPID